MPKKKKKSKYKCPVCGREFKTFNEFEKHMKMGEKEYE